MSVQSCVRTIPSQVSPRYMAVVKGVTLFYTRKIFFCAFCYFCFEEMLNASFELDYFEASWMKLLLVIISLRITFQRFPLVMYTTGTFWNEKIKMR